MSQEEVSQKDEVVQGEEVPESTLALPISRIKKIMKLDPEYVTSTEGAVYLTGIATELFIMYLAEQAAFVAKANQRKKVMYKDFVSVINTKDSLNFLADIAPPVYPLKKLVEAKKVRYRAKVDDVVEPEPEAGAAVEGAPVTDEADEKRAPVALDKGQQVLNFQKVENPYKKVPLTNFMNNDDEATTETESVSTPKPTEPISLDSAEPESTPIPADSRDPTDAEDVVMIDDA